MLASMPADEEPPVPAVGEHHALEAGGPESLPDRTAAVHPGGRRPPTGGDELDKEIPW
jgi:hypothetical protein